MTAAQAPAPRRARRVPYRPVALAASGAAADVAFDPVHRRVPLCPFHAFTGGWCPLCGGLRAVDSLVHLQFGVAVHDNLLLMAALPLVLVWWIDRAVRGGTARRDRPRYLVVVIVASAVAFTVVRNLPFGVLLRPG